MSTQEKQMHPAAVCQVMINFAGHRSVDKASCLLGTGITEAALSSVEGLVSREQEMRLIENIILATPEGPALGFELGLQYSLATFGVWGFALRTSKTLRDAVLIGIRYLPLSTVYCQVALIDEGDDFGISLDPSSIPPHLRQFLLERRQIALLLLENSSMKMDELAAYLGFMDAGGFVRAFRRWLGCSPSEYRESKKPRV